MARCARARFVCIIDHSPSSPQSARGRSGQLEHRFCEHGPRGQFAHPQSRWLGEIWRIHLEELRQRPNLATIRGRRRSRLWDFRQDGSVRRLRRQRNLSELNLQREQSEYRPVLLLLPRSEGSANRLWCHAGCPGDAEIHRRPGLAVRATESWAGRGRQDPCRSDQSEPCLLPGPQHEGPR